MVLQEPGKQLLGHDLAPLVLDVVNDTRDVRLFHRGMRRLMYEHLVEHVRWYRLGHPDGHGPRIGRGKPRDASPVYEERVARLDPDDPPDLSSYYEWPYHFSMFDSSYLIDSRWSGLAVMSMSRIADTGSEWPIMLPP